MFSPNHLQQDVFNAVQSSRKPLVIVARAGTGKTTTIIEAVNRLDPSEGSVLLCAFNKSIQKELEKRAPRHVDVRTLHSLGYGCLRRMGKFRVDADKTRTIVKRYLGDIECYTKGRVGALLKLIGLAKNTLTYDIPGLEDLAYDFDIEDTDNTATILASQAKLLLGRCKEDTATIDFDDMIWMPVVLNLPPRCYDTVFVDEAQDLNPCQQWMIHQTLRKGGRIIAVGDDRQAIYGWRGAGSAVLDDIQGQFGATKLPLSITYRCPKSVVKLAQQIVPDYRADDSAPQGVVDSATMEDLVASAGPGDFILSRTNAPLMAVCLQLLRQGVPAQVRGRDIGRSLASVIKKSETTTVKQLGDWLEDYVIAERERLLPNREAAYEVLLDKVDCLYAMMEGERETSAVINKIERIFADTNSLNYVVCSTVHKAKGLERKRVWVLENTFRVGSGIEEDNIWYVAITRAQETLRLVSED